MCRPTDKRYFIIIIIRRRNLWRLQRMSGGTFVGIILRTMRI